MIPFIRNSKKGKITVTVHQQLPSGQELGEWSDGRRDKGTF